MLKRKISKHRLILLAILIFAISFGVTPIMFARASTVVGVQTNPIPPGCQMIDFEEGLSDGDIILSTIEGLQFTTTEGYNWVYGGIMSGRYNIYSLTEDIGFNLQTYCCNGLFFAWLTEWQGTGRIDFTLGTASYFSILTSTGSGLQIDAYDGVNPDPIATSGCGGNVPYNIEPLYFTRLTVEAEGMAYIIIHNSGNYWLIDDLVTDAPGVGTIDATIDFDPDSLNPKSRGKFVTVYIELPAGYDVNAINISTIELTYGVGSVSAEVTPTNISDGILMVKFDRQEVIAILEPGEEIEIAVSGESFGLEEDFGFYGTIDIRVLDFYEI